MPPDESKLWGRASNRFPLVHQPTILFRQKLQFAVASQLPAPEQPCGLPAACAKRSGVERTKRIWFSGEVSKNPSVLLLTPKHLPINMAAFMLSPLSVDSAPLLATPSGACCCLPLKARP